MKKLFGLKSETLIPGWRLLESGRIPFRLTAGPDDPAVLSPLLTSGLLDFWKRPLNFCTFMGVFGLAGPVSAFFSEVALI